MARKKRQIPIKKPDNIAFVVDGKTEKWYLQMLKRNESSLSLDIKPELATQKSLEQQEAMVLEKKEDYTKVFWIVDYDVIAKEDREFNSQGEKPKQKFARLRKKLSQFENVEVLVNNPCLELWVLLHFQKTSKYFPDCDSAQKEVKKHLKGYQKTEKFYTKQGKDIYLQLKPRLPQARENTKPLTFDPHNSQKSVCEMNILFDFIDKTQPNTI